MDSQVILESKLAGATRLYSFTFSLPVGVTISSASCSAIVVSGTDVSPSAIISGLASISGAVVSQAIVAGTVGVIYLLTCTANLSNGEILQQAGDLAVVPAGS